MSMMINETKIRRVDGIDSPSYYSLICKEYKDKNLKFIYNDGEVNGMSFLKKHAEILYSYIIGLASLLIGIIILVNIPLIHKLNGKEKVTLYID
ncbi:hypothetical protein BU607_08265, partial [Staphylococcus auricularis]